MPLITITLEDTEEVDGINFKVVFDPPINDDTVLSAAQSEAAFILEVMQRRASGETLAEIAEEMDDDEYGRLAGGYEPGGVVTEDKEPEGNN